MGVSELSFVLMIIIEGCVGPRPDGQCAAQNFAVRLPYDRIEQCEDARKNIVAPSGAQKHVRGLCIAVPKAPSTKQPVS